MNRLPYKGMMAPTFAPFKADGSLNLSMVKPYAAHLKKNGICGVFVNGTVGEGMNMTVEERKALAEAWLDCRSDVPTVIIQCGAVCFKDVIDLVSHAEKHGASGIAVLPPLYDKPTKTDALVDYVEEVAKHCPKTPLFYYHFPAKTEVQLSMSEFLQKGVKRVPTLSGIKFTDGDVSGEGKACLEVDGGSLTIFLGYDGTLYDALSVGFTAGINVSYNFLPHIASQIYSLMDQGDKEQAFNKQRQLDDYFDVVFELNRVPSTNYFKTSCTLLTGMQLGPTRFPVKPLQKEEIEMLKSLLVERLRYKVY